MSGTTDQARRGQDDVRTKGAHDTVRKASCLHCCTSLPLTSSQPRNGATTAAPVRW
jgi:hypothetical protein